MVNSCVSSSSYGGGLKQGSIGFKKIGELTADGKNEDDFKNIVRIAKVKLAVVQAKIAVPATRVVTRLNDTYKVTKEHALAPTRQ